MKGTTRRRPTESFTPYPTPVHRRFTRGSDASLASSRPSSVVIGRSDLLLLPTDKSHQAAAVRSINSFLSLHGSILSLKPHPISSSKDIVETLNFILVKLDFPVTKLEDDLYVVLKLLNCPFKVSKSALRAPNTPHNWPSFLAVMRWLVEVAMYREHLDGEGRSFGEGKRVIRYVSENYLHYLRGEDDDEEAKDREFVEELEKERDVEIERVRDLEEEFKRVEEKVERLRKGPTEREKLESNRVVLEVDVSKFVTMIKEFNQRIEGMEKVLEEKGQELEVKLEGKRRIDVESEGLEKRVEEQRFDARDAERMKRELLVVERAVGDAENARCTWEEKIWDLEAAIEHKLKELKGLELECNQTMRRLKVGNGLQYVLNANGSTPAEITGIDYKSALKPGLESFDDDLKKSSVAKLDELISLQKQLSEFSDKTGGKENRVASLQSQIDQVDAQLSLLRKEREDYTFRCEAEARRMVEDVQTDAHNMDSLERESAEVVKATMMKLQERTRLNNKEIQKEARELFAVVDVVTEYKEHAESTILEIRSKLSETAAAVADTFKGSLPALPTIVT